MSDDYIAGLYDELRRIAGRRMAYEPADHTLQPTALVHEAWLRVHGRGLAARLCGRELLLGVV